MRLLSRPVVAVASVVLLSASTWRAGELPVEPIADVKAHPTIPSLAFAVTSSGIFRSVDRGRMWQRVSEAALNSLSFIQVHTLAFDPFDEREVCALGDSAISCSSDLGETWHQLPKPGVTFLLFDPRVRDRMLMGTPYGMQWLFVSDDHGRTWTGRGSHDVHPWFHGNAAVDRSTGAIIESGSPHGGCIPVCSLFRSDDQGHSWREINAAVDAWTFASNVLYVARDESFSASTNAGLSFVERGRIPSPVQVLAADPNRAEAVYAGNAAGNVFQSKDGGRTWFRIDRSEILGPVRHISVGADGVVYIATDIRVLVQPAANRRRAVAR